MTSYTERCAAHQYIDAIWRRTADGTDHWVPADGCWDIIFAWQEESIRVFIAGPMTKAKLIRHAAGTELLGIRFRPGVYMLQLLPSTIVDSQMYLHSGSARSFAWLEGTDYEIPTYETAELFVDKLLSNKVLVRDPVIDSVLKGQTAAISSRSTQRHFAKTLGLTRKFLEQVKRAQATEELLRTQTGLSASSIAVQAGYADQAHMTRSFKLLFGRTPSQLAHAQSTE